MCSCAGSSQSGGLCFTWGLPLEGDQEQEYGHLPDTQRLAVAAAGKLNEHCTQQSSATLEWHSHTPDQAFEGLTP